MGAKFKLKPCPISDFICNTLPCSDFSFSRSTCSFPLPVPRFSSIRKPKKYFKLVFLLVPFVNIYIYIYFFSTIKLSILSNMQRLVHLANYFTILAYSYLIYRGPSTSCQDQQCQKSQGHPTTASGKMSIRRSKYCLEFSIRTKNSYKNVPFMYNFRSLFNKFLTIF